jgi:hypothetical protein
MKILVASDSFASLAIADQLKASDHQTDCVANCETMDGALYDVVVYDSTPCLEDRHGDPGHHASLLDFSDVVVSAYRITNDHPEAYHVLLSSDESLYRDGSYYGKNRKLVEEVYFLMPRYLVVRCADIVWNGPNETLDRLLGYKPFPYTPDSTLQFIGLQSVVDVVCGCLGKLSNYPTVLTASGKGCVTVEELCSMARVTPVIDDPAKKVSRDCDSSMVDRLYPFVSSEVVKALKSSKDYAREYIDRKLLQETFART